MAKKYVFNSLMILACLLAMGGMVLPFYTSYISAVYGDTLIQGSIMIPGICFALGFDAIGFDDFAGTIIRVIPQKLITVIMVLLIILFVASIVSICVKKKNSIFYFIFNLVFGITGLTVGVLTAASDEIMNVTLDGEIGLEQGGILEGGLISEGLGFGAIITAVLAFVLGVLAISLAAVCLYDYRNQEDESLRTYPHYAGSLDYTQETLLIEEEKEPKRLFFRKKEKVIETDEENEDINRDEGVNVSSENNFHTNTQEIVVDENKTTEDLKEETFNESLVDETDSQVTQEIETPQVGKKKTLEEKLANLNKLRDERKITEAEYKKYKEAMIEEHFSSRNK